MFLILKDMRGKSLSSREDQIVRTDLLFGMLVVDTRGRVQNMIIMKFIMFLKVLSRLCILKPSFVHMYQG